MQCARVYFPSCPIYLVLSFRFRFHFCFRLTHEIGENEETFSTKNANLPPYRIVLYRIALYRILRRIISYGNVCIVLYRCRIVYVKLSRQTIKNRFVLLIGNFAKRK